MDEYELASRPTKSQDLIALTLTLISNQQPATSNQQPATSNQQPATSNQQPAIKHPTCHFFLLLRLGSILDTATFANIFEEYGT